MTILPILFIDTIVGFLILLLIVGFESAILCGIRYTVSDDILTVSCCTIKSGFCKINDIESITATRNMISAPASTLDRLEIKLNSGSMIISPKNKEQFMALLIKENSQIKVIK